MADPILHVRHGEHIIEIKTRPSKYKEAEFLLWGIREGLIFGAFRFPSAAF